MNSNFLKYLRILWGHVEYTKRKHFFYIFFLMLLASLSELVSLGAIIPFLSVLTKPDLLFTNKHIQPLIAFFNINNPQSLILPVTITFAFTAIFSGIIRLLLLWAQTEFAYGLVADFSIKIYKRTLYQPYNVHLSRNSSEIISGITYQQQF